MAPAGEAEDQHLRGCGCAGVSTSIPRRYQKLSLQGPVSSSSLGRGPPPSPSPSDILISTPHHGINVAHGNALRYGFAMSRLSDISLVPVKESSQLGSKLRVTFAGNSICKLRRRPAQLHWNIRRCISHREPGVTNHVARSPEDFTGSC